MNALERAQQNLTDFINSLSPEDREKALAYQKGLEEEATKTEGGMTAVIVKRTKHLTLALAEELDELQECAAEHIAKAVIAKHR